MSYVSISTGDLHLNFGRSYAEQLFELFIAQSYDLPCPYLNPDCRLRQHLLNNWTSRTTQIWSWDKDNKGMPVYAVTRVMRGVRIKKTSGDTLPENLVIGETYGNWCNYVNEPEHHAYDMHPEAILVNGSEGVLDFIKPDSGLGDLLMETVLERSQDLFEKNNNSFIDYINNGNDSKKKPGPAQPPSQGLFQTLPGTFSPLAHSNFTHKHTTQVVSVPMNTSKVSPPLVKDTVYRKPDGTFYTCDSEGVLQEIRLAKPKEPEKPTRKMSRKQKARIEKERLELEKMNKERRAREIQARKQLDELTAQAGGELKPARKGLAEIHAEVHAQQTRNMSDLDAKIHRAQRDRWLQ